MAGAKGAKSYTQHVPVSHKAVSDYSSLRKNPLRRDWDRNVAYTNEVEMLLRQGIKIMQDKFVVPAAHLPNPLSPFIHVESEEVDPLVGWTLAITGWTTAYHEEPIGIGDHLTARVHAEIPRVVMRTYSYFGVRNTYSSRREWKLQELSASDTDEFYANQLAAFAKSEENWFKFLGYLLFADLEEVGKTRTDFIDNGNNGQQPYPWKVDEELQDPHFEEFKKIMFCPKPEQGNKKEIPWYGINLALEYVPIINPDHMVTDHKKLKKIVEIASKLIRNKEEWDPQKLLFDHDLPEAAKELLSMIEQSKDKTRKMVLNSIKYRIQQREGEGNKEGFVATTLPSDLIYIMNDLDGTLLDNLVPSIVKPDATWGFTPENLGVGMVLKSPWIKRGTALIIHKDALQVRIVKNDVGSASYPEQGVVNRWHSVGYFFDLFEMFPCCFLAKKAARQ